MQELYAPYPFDMTVLGVDPGLHVTGYGLIGTTAEALQLIEAGVIHTDDDQESLAHRLVDLHRSLGEILDEFKPGVMAIEQLYSHYDHPRTAILMGHARGVLLLAAAERSVEVVSYAATSIKKKVTGSGRAGKEQMQYAVARELGLAAIPEPHDAADALAIAICHVRSAGPVHGTGEARYTAVNRRMLEGE
jgi:crossover junction endodeoxyribonuclease RuvC